jgi:hypothetical protein
MGKGKLNQLYIIYIDKINFNDNHIQLDIWGGGIFLFINGSGVLNKMTQVMNF